MILYPLFYFSFGEYINEIIFIYIHFGFFEVIINASHFYLISGVLNGMRECKRGFLFMQMIDVCFKSIWIFIGVLFSSATAKHSIFTNDEDTDDD